MKKEKTNKLETCPSFDDLNNDENSSNQGMMKCMKGEKWFLLLPGVIIILAFVLGYLLNPEIVKMLWLIITGTLIVMGSAFYVLMNLWVNRLQRRSSN